MQVRTEAGKGGALNKYWGEMIVAWTKTIAAVEF